MDQFEYGFKVIFNMRPQFGFGNNRRRGKDAQDAVVKYLKNTGVYYRI